MGFEAYGGFLLPEKYLLFERFKKINLVAGVKLKEKKFNFFFSLQLQHSRRKILFKTKRLFSLQVGNPSRKFFF